MPDLLAPPVTDATRREFLALLATAGLLSGCAGTPTAPAAGDGQTFTDSLGRTVDIPARPQRIVSTQAYTSGQALLSVGAPVVGLEEETPGAFGPHVTDYDLSGVTPIGTFSEINLETVARIAPDLIVGYAYRGESSQGDIERFQAIAPTVALDEASPLDEFMAQIGQITGLGDAVQQQRREYEADLDALRQVLGGTASALTIAVVGAEQDGNAYVFTHRHQTAYVTVPLAVGVGVQDLGETAEMYASISGERFSEIAADVLLYHSEIWGDPTALELWPRHPAVQAGQAYRMPFVGGASYVNARRAIAALRDVLPGADPGVAT